MPTVPRVGAFRVIILFPPREHGPAHVHVVTADGLARIDLARQDIPQQTSRVDGMKQSDVRKAERIVSANTDYLLAERRKIHGDTD